MGNVEVGDPEAVRENSVRCAPPVESGRAGIRELVVGNSERRVVGDSDHSSQAAVERGKGSRPAELLSRCALRCCEADNPQTEE